MAKRRTKKQKQEAKHLFTLSWEPAVSGSTSKPVKSQSKSENLGTTFQNKASKNAKKSEKDTEFVYLKRELTKTLLFASLILGLELVLYLADRKLI